MSNEEFATDLLNKEHVVIVPGTAFGESGEGFIRISYAYSLDALKEAIKRIERYLKSISNKYYSLSYINYSSRLNLANRA